MSFELDTKTKSRPVPRDELFKLFLRRDAKFVNKCETQIMKNFDVYFEFYYKMIGTKLNFIIFKYKCGLFFRVVHIYCESLVGAINWGKICCYTVWVEFRFSWDNCFATQFHAFSRFKLWCIQFFILYVSFCKAQGISFVYFECCLNTKIAFRNISKYTESTWTSNNRKNSSFASLQLLSNLIQ
jgi:hypothetical protein